MISGIAFGLAITAAFGGVLFLMIGLAPHVIPIAEQIGPIWLGVMCLGIAAVFGSLINIGDHWYGK